MTARAMVKVALIVTLVFAPTVFGGDPIALLRVGSFHGDEIAPDSDGPWLALVPDSSGAYLRTVRASITTEEDPIVDDEGEASGKNVQIMPPVEAAALLRGIAALRPGRIPTALKAQPIEPGRAVAVRIGQRPYSFAVRCVDRKPVEGQRQHDCQLVVQSGASEVKLFTYLAYTEDGQLQWASEHPPTVIWAGDIDGDGRLDLLLDTSNHYNVEEMSLFLSSSATPGQLLRVVATFQSVGC